LYRGAFAVSRGTPVIKILAAFAVAAVFSASAEPSASHVQSVEKSAIELHQLFDHYQHAVAAKNSKELLGCFLNETVPFVGAFAPASYELISSANKQQVPRTFSSNAKEDADSEIKLPPDQIENLSIQTDGEVGTVSWDYYAKIGHGRIIWSTVLTNDGWKIASVTYSINVSAAAKNAASR
jgi:hypothetical protein